MTMRDQCIEAMAEAIRDEKGGVNYDYLDFCHDEATAALDTLLEKLKSPTEEMSLLPCPFCGGERALVGPIRDGAAVCCSNLKCLGQVQTYNPDARAKAIAAWNKRAPIAMLSTLSQHKED